MKRKVIETAFILFIVAGMSIAAGYYLTKENNTSKEEDGIAFENIEIPNYPGAKKTNPESYGFDPPPSAKKEGAGVTYYLVENSNPQNIMNWFKNNLTKWNLENSTGPFQNEDNTLEMGMQAYTREKYWLQILTVENSKRKGSIYVKMKMTKEAAEK